MLFRLAELDISYQPNYCYKGTLFKHGHVVRQQSAYTANAEYMRGDQWHVRPQSSGRLLLSHRPRRILLLDCQTLEASGETARLEGRIREMYASLLADLPSAMVQVVAGIPHNELLRLARKKDTDLVVMGPHTKARIKF